MSCAWGSRRGRLVNAPSWLSAGAVASTSASAPLAFQERVAARPKPRTRSAGCKSYPAYRHCDRKGDATALGGDATTRLAAGDPVRRQRMLLHPFGWACSGATRAGRALSFARRASFRALREMRCAHRTVSNLVRSGLCGNVDLGLCHSHSIPAQSISAGTGWGQSRWIDATLSPGDIQ